MSEDWKEALEPTPECIDIARLGEELTAAEQAHLETCVRCQTELALFRDVMAEETSPASQWIAGKLANPKAEARPPHSIRRVLYAVAAALVILVGASWWMQYHDVSIETGSSVYRSVVVDVVGPSGDVANPPNELRWKPVPDATRYSVQILEVDQNPVWNAQTTETHVTLPPDVAAAFLPGKRLLWDVTAYRGDAILATSETQNVRVTP